MYWKQRLARTQAQVRRTAAALRNNLVDHLVEAMAITGRTLPGPIPEWAPERHLTCTKEQR